VVRQVVVFGVVGGVLIAALKWGEYRFLVVEHSIEIYGGLIAVTFAVLGIWLGLRITARRGTVFAKDEAVGEGAVGEAARSGNGLAGGDGNAGERAVADEKRREELGITRRELEILELIALGMSNREIAAKLFVSENTVKTHSSRVFEKLGAKRRTQAVQLGKELGLLG
jgi:two-component system, NarL family, response regulator LiaR